MPRPPSSRIHILEQLFDDFNLDFFEDKLSKVSIQLESRNRTWDGVYHHFVSGKTQKLPDPDRLDDAILRIHTACFSDEDKLHGTLLHEMIHQYQAEVLGRCCNHDAVFLSIARKAERRYQVPVR